MWTMHRSITYRLMHERAIDGKGEQGCCYTALSRPSLTIVLQWLQLLALIVNAVVNIPLFVVTAVKTGSH